jgi:hypothetical protein
MVLFLAGFFALYSLLHLYVFVRARAALDLGFSSIIPLVLFMLIMITAPATARLLENAGLDLPARLMAYGGYTWMGLLFLFICTSTVLDLYRLLIFVAGRALKVDISHLTASRASYFLIAVCVVAIIGIYGYFEARTIRLDKTTIITPKIPAASSPIRIVQISDVHLGAIVRDHRLKSIMDQVKKADPDIFVSTGDLVDGRTEGMDTVARLLREASPRYGKFAVTGNHEYYSGLGQALAFTKKSGFHVLHGEAVTVGSLVNIVGVDDPAGTGISSTRKGEDKLLRTVNKDLFTILLKHRPVVDEESIGLFDLQLSGHVHKGQIFPFRLITRLFFPFYAGLYSFSGGSLLYVNRGSGTWGPPIRFLTPPEVTVIELVHGTAP